MNMEKALEIFNWHSFEILKKPAHTKCDVGLLKSFRPFCGFKFDCLDELASTIKENEPTILSPELDKKVISLLWMMCVEARDWLDSGLDSFAVKYEVDEHKRFKRKLDYFERGLACMLHDGMAYEEAFEVFLSDE